MAPNKIGGPPSFAEAPAAGDEDSKIISSDEVKARGCGTDDIEDIAFIFPRDELRVWFTGTLMILIHWCVCTMQHVHPLMAAFTTAAQHPPQA